MTEISYGNKYEAGLDVTEIAKRVRKDIAVAIKAGDLPKGLKVSIRTSVYSGGQSLDPTIMAVPEGFTIHTPEWVKATDANENTYRSRVEAHTPEAKAVAKKIKAMIGAYNYDGSDIMTDYFNVNFYGGHVSWDGRLEKADKDRVRAKLNGEPEPDDTPLEFGPEAVVKCLTEATHWTNWSVSEVSRDLHVGADKARKVLDAMAEEDKLFKTWSHQRQAIIYRLPKKGDTPESAKANREHADKKAAETKEARASRKVERKKAHEEYLERRAREDEATKAKAAQMAEKDAEEKAERDAKEAKDGKLAERTRAKAAQLALGARYIGRPKKVTKVDLSGPTFMNKTIGWC